MQDHKVISLKTYRTAQNLIKIHGDNQARFLATSIFLDNNKRHSARQFLNTVLELSNK